MRPALTALVLVALATTACPRPAHAQSQIGGAEIPILGIANPIAHWVTPNGTHVVVSAPAYPQDGVHLHRSTDGGISWQLWSTIADDGDPMTEVLGSDGLAVFNTTNRLFVAYVTTHRNASNTITHQTANVAWADANAANPTWNEVTLHAMSTNTYRLGNVVLATDASQFGDYHVYASYERVGVDGARDVWFSRSTDQGTTFEPTYEIGTSAGGDEYLWRPQIAYGHGGWVHVVWERSFGFLSEEDTRLEYRGVYGRGNPANWDATPVHIGDVADPSDLYGEFEATIAARAGANGLMVAFEVGNFFGENGVRCIYSSDNGRSWVRNTAADGVLHSDPVLYYGPDGFGMAAQDYQDDLQIRRPTTADPLGPWESLDMVSPNPSGNSSSLGVACAPIFDQTRGDGLSLVFRQHHPGGDASFDAEWFTEPGFPLAGWRINWLTDSDLCVVDLEGDGRDEILATSASHLSAYEWGRYFREGFPLTVGGDMSGDLGQIASADFDDDGTNEILVTSSLGVHCYQADGQGRDGWPFLLSGSTEHYVSAALITGRAPLEAAIVTEGALYVVNGGGQTSAGFPATFPTSYGSPTGPAGLADFDGDQRVEILVTLEHAILLYDADGTLQEELWVDLTRTVAGPAAFGRVDFSETAFQIAFSVDDELHVIGTDGSEINQGWPFIEPLGQTLGPPIVTQVLGGIDMDILVATNEPSSSQNRVYVLDEFGQEFPNWPKSMQNGASANQPLFTAPAVATYDNQVITTRDGFTRPFWNPNTTIPAWPRQLSPAETKLGAFGDFDGNGELDYVSGGWTHVLELGTPAGVPGWYWPQYCANAARTGGLVENENLVTSAAEPHASTVSFRGALPNPARGATTFHFTLPEAGEVQLRVFDLRGREVWKHTPRRYEPGAHAIAWNGRATGGAKLAAGVYLARLVTQRERGLRQSETRKLVITN